jgi:hypothetical protein
VPGEQSAVLVSQGPLSLIGKCDLNNTTESGTAQASDVALVLISTTEDHSAFAGDQGVADDFNATTDEFSRRILRAFNPVIQPAYSSASFTGSAPSGADLSGIVYGSVNAIGHQHECVFGGQVGQDSRAN